jgi:serine/threonine protein kinase
MNSCPACQQPVAEGAAFCPACGQALRAASDATVLQGSISSGPGEGERFAPGQVIGHRYRIVARLGQGGMGEVYRADDLRLGQSVALKFLPEGLERDPERLKLFLEEARTARQVTHANVCRVHDIDEFEGRHFLSMEYVDGEDLASLLRRIGRVPEERAVEVARQVCRPTSCWTGAGRSS